MILLFVVAFVLLLVFSPGIGLVPSAILGLGFTILFGAYLDARKSAWTGRRRLDGAEPRSDSRAPGRVLAGPDLLGPNPGATVVRVQVSPDCWLTTEVRLGESVREATARALRKHEEDAAQAAALARREEEKRETAARVRGMNRPVGPARWGK